MQPKGQRAGGGGEGQPIQKYLSEILVFLVHACDLKIAIAV